jgi:hypothetical protein
MDLDFSDLGAHLSGSLTSVAHQTLGYLTQLAERRAAESDIQAEEARLAHAEAITARHAGVALRQDAFERRNAEIIRRLVSDPELPTRGLKAEYHTSSDLIARLRTIARDRARLEG